nr:MAG TPA: hypothetical protein [Caudoviricetes sp.]
MCAITYLVNCPQFNHICVGYVKHHCYCLINYNRNNSTRKG